MYCGEVVHLKLVHTTIIPICPYFLILFNIFFKRINFLNNIRNMVVNTKLTDFFSPITQKKFNSIEIVVLIFAYLMVVQILLCYL